VSATIQSPSPVEIPFVRLHDPSPDTLEELLGVVREVATEGAFTMGRHLDLFERDFASFCDAEHAVGVASGTDALELALRGLGIGRGDEVMVPANSFIATAEAVSAVGAIPRFADVDPDTQLITAETASAALTERVACIIPVHLYGRTVDMDPLLALARDHDLLVVEDACQAHGARYRGRRVGSIGDAGCFSFYPAKNLGAWGDGGALVTADPELADRVRLLRSHGERPRYQHHVIGGTARLDALQAAILRVKLRDLDDANEARRRGAARLRAGLVGSSVESPALPADAGDHVFHLFVVRVDDRDAVRDALAARGIASGIHYPTPIHLTGAYAHLGYRAGSLPIVESLARRICSLPMFPSIEDDEIDAIAAAVTEVTDL